MFITLHEPNGDPVAVNPTNIDRIETRPHGYLLVQTNGEVPAIAVKEGPDEIEELSWQLAEKTALKAVILAQKVTDGL